MAHAKMEMLRLEFPIASNRVYHDDGFVPSIADQVRKFNSLYGIEESDYDQYSGKVGLHSKTTDLPITHDHICYVDRGSNPLNVYTRGHEETHAVESYDQLDLLAAKILEEQRVRISFREINEAEVKAAIGGIVAMCAEGINPDLIKSGDLDFNMAKIILKMARFSR